MTLIIRDYQPADAVALTDIFYQTIHEVAISHYTEAQVNAWAPLPIDYAHWRERLDGRPPFVAEIDGRIVGFITLTETGYIDWTFTHKDFQGQGIASALYCHLEHAAQALRLPLLTVSASLLAKPFFEKQGFVVLSENRVERRGELLTNFSMEKQLDY